MTFRQAVGLTWMISVGSWVVEYAPALDFLFSADNFGEVIGGLAFIFLLTAITISPGYVIGWVKLDDEH